MNIYETFSFDTAQGALRLLCIDIAEPNNGRMLYEIKLELNELDVTDRYFDKWNYINFSIYGYKPVSPDKKWMYIPKEGDHFLINAGTLAKTELPHLLLSAATFLGNTFSGDYLLIVSAYEIISKNLETGAVHVLKRPDDKIYFKKASISGQSKVLLELSDGNQSVVMLETLTPG